MCNSCMLCAVVELLCRVALGHLFQMGRLAGSIIEGPHPLSGRGEFRSFATLNVAWNGLVRLLRVVPEECRPAILQLKGGFLAPAFRGLACIEAALCTARTRQCCALAIISSSYQLDADG
jgi:hypothetical protein